MSRVKCSGYKWEGKLYNILVTLFEVSDVAETALLQILQLDDER